MYGAVVSLVGRSVQLMKRVRMEPEFTLIGGIMRFDAMARVVRDAVHAEVNVPPPDMVQFVSALGAALLGQRRLARLLAERAAHGARAGAA
jgi:activator of 2-hydroxyglutaryl-CoA dehydratase